VNYLIYSHSEFADILEVQTDYLKDVKNKILFINKNNDDSLHKIYSNYKDVIFYDDREPYASRLIFCLNRVIEKHKIEYAIFMHDIDILFYKDDLALSNCLNLMKLKGIHRIDFQFDALEKNRNQKLINLQTFEIEKEPKLGSYYARQDLFGSFAYNVNPSIWNLRYFLNLLNIAPTLSYRQIELNSQIQTYAKHSVKSHKLACIKEELSHCGYFSCLPFFIFFHITHAGKLVPIDQDHKFFIKFGPNSYDVKGQYQKILKNYNLSSKRIHG